jgi:hypothetical protein
MTYNDITTLENCPNCSSSWVDSIIPEEYRENYSPPYFYSRVVGVELLGGDRVDHWRCPDCNHKFPRGY